MGKLKLITGFLIVFFAAVACSNDDPPVAQLNAPVLVSSVPEDGAQGVNPGELTITLTFDQNVFCPSSAHQQISISNAQINSVSVKLREIILHVSGLEEGKTCKLTIPADVIFGPTEVGAKKIDISFTTREPIVYNISKKLVSKSPSKEVKNVYDFLLDNYGKKTVSAVMANVAWNTNEAEWVKLQTGKYPAMATFDYIFLPFSPANWIDYSNTAAIEDWWNKNGLIAAGWHWNVPTFEGSTEYAFYTENTTFKAANATVDGTWENDLVKTDLEKMAGYLKLLQDKNIPVIWRPLHEAAGNIYEYQGGSAWFWWGNDGADAYKKLWVYMFDYFSDQHLKNLIWVWTTQTMDDAFYPGDDYVDIVGRDIYNNGNAASIAEQFTAIRQKYPTKMVTLSEMGNVASISEQWSKGAKWSYFMPWYDYDRTNDTGESDFAQSSHQHANAAWWIDAMSNPAVIIRDSMPSLK